MKRSRTTTGQGRLLVRLAIPPHRYGSLTPALSRVDVSVMSSFVGLYGLDPCGNRAPAIDLAVAAGIGRRPCSQRGLEWLSRHPLQ